MVHSFSKLFIVAVGVLAPMSFALSAYAGEGWPLRNGDFSRNEFTVQAERPDWRLNPQPGVTVRRQDREPWTPILNVGAGDTLWRPGIVTLQSEQADRAALFQDVWLLPGRYTFHVEAQTTPDALLAIDAGGSKATYSGADWAETVVDFSVKDAGEVVVELRSQRLGEVRLRNARIDVRQVHSAAVALEDGGSIGAIILPPEPTEAERYAAWELQKFIFRMTANAPGVAGRDETAAGIRIRIGRAAGRNPFGHLLGLVPDSYLVARYRGGDVILAGTNDRGTVYAVYDFLTQQGCGWFWPGPSGEVVPRRDALQTEAGERVESPDWLIRGLDKKRPDWEAGKTPRAINVDDYIDWLVRNRQNALLASQAMTIDFGKWRGGSHVIRTNHSLHAFWMTDPINPEWAPLVAGKRKPRHGSGRPNMACTSNQEVRDRTVQIILEFFRQRPEATILGLNTDDEPADWCECPKCRAQDPDKGAQSWQVSRIGVPLIAMTDRWLNYVNEVAERVAKVYPDKLIETYAYASTRIAPTRERVHPNVLVRFTLYPAESPYGISVRDRSFEPNDRLHRTLEGWQRAGPRHLCFYDYDNYRYDDTVFSWFYRIADTMRTFHDDWGFRYYLAEHHNSFSTSYMGYNVRARLLWDSSADYRAVIRDVCDRLYGPIADTVCEYYRHMDQVMLDYWQKHADDYRGENAPEDFDSTYRPLELEEYSFADMATGQALLDHAWAAAAEDTALRARLAGLRFGHAMSTLVLAVTAEAVGRKVSQQEARQAETAWQVARDLCAEYRIMTQAGANRVLQSFYIAPRVQRELFALPVVWKFKLDPGDQGLKENWQQATPDDSWKDIRTDSSWTAQGHQYHGIAWYLIEFSLSEEVRKALRKAAEASPAFLTTGPGPALHFGAVDGYADVYLDGVKIGEQKKPPSMMWKNPFAVPLAADGLARDGKHRLVVRVKKEQATAGIWKPVHIVILAD